MSKFESEHSNFARCQFGVLIYTIGESIEFAFMKSEEVNERVVNGKGESVGILRTKKL